MPALLRLMLRLEDECLGNQTLRCSVPQHPNGWQEHPDLRWEELGAVQWLSPTPVLTEKGELRPLL